MKYSKTLHLSVLLAIATILTTGSALAADPAGQSQRSLSALPEAMLKGDESEISQNYAQSELDTFFSSGYTYWDAAQLASYWGQDVDEAKARMGRKILWGPADVALLEQFLLDARLESLQSVDELRFYSETSYTYDDAAALAEFWGDATPYEAKLRIERNLIMGNADEVDYALELAAPEP
ncbi:MULTISPECIES: hypothetical protein [Cyanophyceae]|uniref:hypothetical protein n=1 Tax=Cyanophyceae TaxID=3028117 RepID=UPI0018F010D4|nr:MULTISPECIES: hypothetical protein [unclassified Phormidium]